MPKINLLPKVEEISEVEKTIRKNEEKIIFSEKLKRLFPAAEELIQQDHETEELPLPNHAKSMEDFNKGKLPSQLQLLNGGLSQTFETRVKKIGINQAN